MADLLQRQEQEELHDEPSSRRRAAPRERASKAWREDARAAGRHHRASRATGSGLGTWRASDHPGHGGTGRGARSPASRADALALRSRLAPRLAPAQAINMGGPEMAPQTPQRSERPGEPVALLDRVQAPRPDPEEGTNMQTWIGRTAVVVTTVVALGGAAG